MATSFRLEDLPQTSRLGARRRLRPRPALAEAQRKEARLNVLTATDPAIVLRRLAEAFESFGGLA